MNNTPKLIIFDWDGTLADSTQPIIATMQHAFRQCGPPEPAAEAVRHLIGRSLPNVVHELAPDLSAAQYSDIVRAYQAFSHSPQRSKTVLFPQALPCLKTLQKQGYWLAVATGKGRKGLDLAMADTETADIWFATRCADESVPKPAPDMVLEICERLGVEPKNTVVVGDTTYDLDMAANAKAAAVGVLTGAHKREMLAASPHIALLDDLSKLPDILAAHFSKH
ncbi:MAG: HAD-IA family hydrolase [Neisseria sp.]|nr:HAD-IA family hydrolase [Neisseria sp.]